MFTNMRLPFVNRFTCSPRQLPKFVELIKKKQMVPIIDNICENGENHDWARRDESPKSL